MKITNLDDLVTARNEHLAKTPKNWIKVGCSTCGIAAGAQLVYNALKTAAKERKLDIKVLKTGCAGQCFAEPLVEVNIEGMPTVIYGKVDEKIAEKIVEQHIESRRMVQDHVYKISRSDSDRKYILIKDTDTDKRKEIMTFGASLESQLRAQGLAENTQVVRVADIGLYNQGIVMRVLPDDAVYKGLEIKHISRIIAQTVMQHQEIKEWSAELADKQLRLVLRNCGDVDPDRIDDYIARDGYRAAVETLAQGKPETTIQLIKDAGLRGRGGAGFSTGVKWALTREVEADQKYIICNADEGDPGAYMDRSVLEGDPHSVLEGMLLGGYCVGATMGYFYIRAEYPLAIDRVQTAIRQAYNWGLLGKNILGSGFDFDIEVRLGAGAFVCGEETALIASVEGKRGTPRPRPPFPSVSGLWGKPTVINNVETLANIAAIVRNGSKWYAGIGTEKSKGTKVFALTGKVRHSSLIEVPMGTSIREIVFDIGGGVLNNRKIKAVQTGGPSGGVIPERFLDTPVEYESLQALGSIMGSGGMIVMDENDCMVDISKFYLGFCVEESCGKCAPCRIGGMQMLTTLKAISEGRGGEESLSLARKIALAMQKASLCGLGQTAPNPVLSTLEYFEDEYKAHIIDGKCPAGVCKNLVNFEIDAEKCQLCGLCAKECPVDAITGDRERGYAIDEARCIRCGRCFEACHFNSVVRR